MRSELICAMAVGAVVGVMFYKHRSEAKTIMDTCEKAITDEVKGIKKCVDKSIK